jgi:hypothetical protein
MHHAVMDAVSSQWMFLAVRPGTGPAGLLAIKLCFFIGRTEEPDSR